MTDTAEAAPIKNHPLPPLKLCGKTFGVEVKRSAEGWFFIYADRQAGPYKYLSQADEVEVAARLNGLDEQAIEEWKASPGEDKWKWMVQPKDVFRAKMAVYTYGQEPSKLPIPEQIKVGDMTVIPSFQDSTKRVHPAIDVVGERAYVGVQLPCTLISKEEPEESCNEDMWFLITSLREKILAHRDVLRTLNLKLSYRPLIPNRWSLPGVAAYLAGQTEDPADPADVYMAIKEAWLQHVDFDNPAYYELLTLWIIGTYFFHLFNTYPYIYFGGTKRTGKTKALTLASCLAFNAIFSANISTASVFRLIQSGRCTLLIDEVEQLVNPERKQDFRALLLSGYKKGGMVYRTEKDRREKHYPEAFEVYSPKMLANIKGLEDVLEDRCINIIMKRSRNRTILNREVDINEPVWQDIRDRLYVLFLTYWKDIRELYEGFSVGCVGSEGSEPIEDTDFLSSRELELWKPIIVLAQFFQKHISSSGSLHTQPTLPTLILELAKRKSLERKVEEMTETGDNILIQTLLTIVNEDCYYSLKMIRDAMAQRFDEEQKWLTNEWVGRALKRLGFIQKRRVGKGVEYQLFREGVKEIAERMGVSTLNDEDISPTFEATPPQLADFLWRKIPVGEKCELCGQLAVEFEINDVKGRQILRRCQNCFEKMRYEFYNARWEALEKYG